MLSTTSYQGREIKSYLNKNYLQINPIFYFIYLFWKSREPLFFSILNKLFSSIKLIFEKQCIANIGKTLLHIKLYFIR